MEIWNLVINRAHGESFTYCFKERPSESIEGDVYRYTGTKIDVYRDPYSVRGRITRIEEPGQIDVYISVRNAINWYIAKEDLEVPEQ